MRHARASQTVSCGGCRVTAAACAIHCPTEDGVVVRALTLHPKQACQGDSLRDPAFALPDVSRVRAALEH
ncbi:hypothetical protein DVH05_009817 [Phytophthora capsici]|nr:hypothetical protein DVH05_009817 [Phytophthora capsici]